MSRPSCHLVISCWLNKNMCSDITAVSFCFGRTKPEKCWNDSDFIYLSMCTKSMQKIAHLYIGTYLHCNWMCHASALVSTVRNARDNTRRRMPLRQAHAHAQTRRVPDFILCTDSTIISVLWLQLWPEITIKRVMPLTSCAATPTDSSVSLQQQQQVWSIHRSPGLNRYTLILQGFKGHAQVIFDLWPFKSLKGLNDEKHLKGRKSGGETDPCEQTDMFWD